MTIIATTATIMTGTITITTRILVTILFAEVASGPRGARGRVAFKQDSGMQGSGFGAVAVGFRA